MVMCAVFGCSSNNNKKLKINKDKNNDSVVKVRYFRFPKDEDISKIWIKKCQRKDNFNIKTSYVCDKHFLPEDFFRNLKHELLNYFPKNVRKLKHDAIPSVNLPFSSSLPKFQTETERHERAVKRIMKSIVSDLLNMDNKSDSNKNLMNEEIFEKDLLLGKSDKSTDTLDIVNESEINIKLMSTKIKELKKKCFELQQENNLLKKILTKQKII